MLKGNLTFLNYFCFQISVNCFEQYCLRKESGWVCKFAGNGRESEFREDLCFEIRYYGKNHVIKRSFNENQSYLRKEKKKRVWENGRICESWSNVNLDFCNCGESLCNDEFRLPKEFKVDSTLEELVDPTGATP